MLSAYGRVNKAGMASATLLFAVDLPEFVKTNRKFRGQDVRWTKQTTKLSFQTSFSRPEYLGKFAEAKLLEIPAILAHRWLGWPTQLFTYASGQAAKLEKSSIIEFFKGLPVQNEQTKRKNPKFFFSIWQFWTRDEIHFYGMKRDRLGFWKTTQFPIFCTQQNLQDFNSIQPCTVMVHFLTELFFQVSRCQTSGHFGLTNEMRRINSQLSNWGNVEFKNPFLQAHL